MSPISSRKIVPPEHCSNLPMRRGSAPVNEPFSWPNNSLSSKRLGNGGAVDRQKRPAGPAAVLIDGAGHQFLAGAAVALDQHRDVLRRHAADGLEHALASPRSGRASLSALVVATAHPG